MPSANNPGSAARADWARHRGITLMLAGTVASAAGAYLFQVIGGRALGAEAFAPVSVMWTLVFLSFTVVLVPIEQLVIRRLTLRGGHSEAMARSWAAIAVVLALGTVGAVLFSLLALNPLLDGDSAYVLVAAAVFPIHGIYVLARGFLAGRARFSAYGLAVGLEASAKLLGAAVVVGVGLGPVALSWALVLAPLASLLVRPFTLHTGDKLEMPVTVSDRRFLGGFLLANAASQTVIGAGPLVVGALGATPAAVSIFFVTTALFRGPMSASYHLIARVLPGMTRRAAAGDHIAMSRLAVRLAAAGVSAGAVGGAIAAWLGPDVVGLLYGGDFRPSPALAGLAGAGVLVGMTGLAITQILVARGHTGRMALAWLAAILAAAGAVVLGPWEPMTLVAFAFLLGEVVALLGLALGALVTSTVVSAAVEGTAVDA